MDFLKVAFIIAFVLLTVFTVRIRPEMHQLMIMEDSDFVLTRISDTVADNNATIAISPEQEKIPVKEVEPAKEVVYVNSDKNISTKTVQVQETQKPIKTTVVTKNIEVPTNKTVQNKPTQVELLERVIKNAEKSSIAEQPKQVKTVVETPVKTVEKSVQKPTVQPKTVEGKTSEVAKTQKSSSNPYMTEQEEIIAWNIWRSNIQNQIMRSSKEAGNSPLGTRYTFTFIVDKFGNISNIKVECSNPDYMFIARNSVKPAISALQKKPILEFPKGTKRTSTIFTGYFSIGVTESYSTPAHYSDYERVVR